MTKELKIGAAAASNGGSSPVLCVNTGWEPDPQVVINIRLRVLQSDLCLFNSIHLVCRYCCG